MPELRLSSRELVVTLEKFHDEQRKKNGAETIGLRTLEEMALTGRLPGAFRCPGSRIWMVNKLALLQQGLEWKHGEEKSQKTQEGNGERRPVRQKPVAGPQTEEGPPRPLRYGS